jgi:hypothetical protein
VITTIVFVPQPLFLLPEYQGRTAPAPDLAAAAVQAVGRLAGAGRLVVVTGDHGGTPNRRPAGARVADELLRGAGIRTRPAELVVPADLPPGACRERGAALAAGDEPRALLVLADGSARRGEKAPGYVDERAFAYDQAFVTAIAQGRPEALAALDAGLATELLFQGRAALAVAAGAVAGRTPSPEILWTGDPFGVMYVVAAWSVT